MNARSGCSPDKFKLRKTESEGRMSTKETLIVDAVSHAYDNSESNTIGKHGRAWNEGTYGNHKLYQPEEYHMSTEQFFKKHGAEELAKILFAESDVDFTIHHSLPIVDFFKDGMVATEESVKLRNQNPDRVAIYEAVNPLEDDALDQVEHAVNDLEADGIKIYPARYKDGETLKLALDEEDSARPVVEKAAELGCNTVAVHKAMPGGPTANEPYKIDDVDEIASSFPDLNFEVVHAGLSFLEETVLMLAKHDNVYANLEVTANLLLTQPRQFAKVLGEMLHWVGPDRLIFASGTVLFHPQPVIEAFWDFEFPADMRSGYDYPELTDEIKAKILGENALELLGRDPDEVRDAIEGDDWEKRRVERGGLADPWSSVTPA